MKRCDEHSADILLYLDNALTDEALEDFRAHLATCPDCRAQLDEERALSALLRKSRPLYSASEGLRARVAAAAFQPASTWATSDQPRKTHFDVLTRWLRGAIRPPLSWKPGAVAIVLFATAGTFAWLRAWVLLGVLLVGLIFPRR